MINPIKFLILLTSLALILGIGIVSAQTHPSFAQQNLGGQEENEIVAVDIAQELNLDENIQAEDLEVSEPKIGRAHV